MRRLWISVTFLLQPQSRACPLLILILPHKGLIHRNQLPCYLSIIFIHSQPAIAGKIVPRNQRKSGLRNTSYKSSINLVSGSGTLYRPLCPQSPLDPGTRMSGNGCYHGGFAASSVDPDQQLSQWKRPPKENNSRIYWYVTSNML